MEMLHPMRRRSHERFASLLPLLLAALTVGACGESSISDTGYAAVRRYEGALDTTEVALRVREGFLPIISEIAGFSTYYLIDAGAGVLVSTGVFRDQAGADASSATAADWVRENLAPLLPNPPQITAGQVVVRKEDAIPPSMYLSVRRYEGALDSAEVTRRVRDGFLPIISEIEGFVAYYLIDAGGGVIVSTSVFRDQAGAELSNATAADWVRENLAPLLPNPPQITAGNVVAHG
jgi:hypothetical protein